MRLTRRTRFRSLLVAAVLGATGSVGLPAGDAQAKTCASPSISCTETLYNFDAFALDVHLSFGSPSTHQISVYVNDVLYSRFDAAGQNRRWAVYRLPPGTARVRADNSTGYFSWIFISLHESDY